MERIDDRQHKSALEWRICTASSIHDMKEGAASLVKDIRDEDNHWYNGLSFVEKLSHGTSLVPLALSSHYPFSWIVLPDLKRPYPSVEIRPQSLIVLPPVTSVPNNRSNHFTFKDFSGEVSVRFPTSLLESQLKGVNVNLNVDELKKYIWTSSVMLLAVYEPEDYYLMKVFNDFSLDRVEQRTGSLKLNPVTMGI